MSVDKTFQGRQLLVWPTAGGKAPWEAVLSAKQGKLVDAELAKIGLGSSVKVVRRWLV